MTATEKYFVIANTGAWGTENPFIINATSKGDCWRQILARYDIYYLFDLEDLICDDKNIDPLTLKLHEKTVEWVFNFEETPVYNIKYLAKVQKALDSFILKHSELGSGEKKYEWSYEHFGQYYDYLVALFDSLDNIYYREFAVIDISNRQEPYITRTVDHNIEYGRFESQFSFTMEDETTNDEITNVDDDEVYRESYKLSEVPVVEN